MTNSCRTSRAMRSGPPPVFSFSAALAESERPAHNIRYVNVFIVILLDSCLLDTGQPPNISTRNALPSQDPDPTSTGLDAENEHENHPEHHRHRGREWQ